MKHEILSDELKRKKNRETYVLIVRVQVLQSIEHFSIRIFVQSDMLREILLTRSLKNPPGVCLRKRHTLLLVLKNTINQMSTINPWFEDHIKVFTMGHVIAIRSSIFKMVYIAYLH